MSTFDEICLEIGAGSEGWRDKLAAYRHHAPSGEGLFAIAQAIVEVSDSNEDRLLVIKVLKECIEILRNASTEVRVPVAAALIRQLARGKQTERAEAALYISWLDALGGSGTDRARGAAYRAAERLRKEFEYLVP